MTTATTYKNSTKRFTLLALRNEGRASKGFTLIELLVVIGILAVLLAITLIAINPARQFSQANNTKRSSDVNAILNAVGQYAADNKGALPTTTTAMSATPTAIGGAVGSIDLCPALVPTYIAGLPVDPLTNNGTPVTTCNATYATNYQISKSLTDSRITVAAPATELGVTVISVTR